MKSTLLVIPFLICLSACGEKIMLLGQAPREFIGQDFVFEGQSFKTGKYSKNQNNHIQYDGLHYDDPTNVYVTHYTEAPLLRNGQKIKAIPVGFEQFFEDATAFYIENFTDCKLDRSRGFFVMGIPILYYIGPVKC